MGPADPSEQSYQIFIRTLTGKTVSLNVYASDTLTDVMVKFMAKEGHNGGRYIFAGKILQEDLSLRYQGIKKETTIHSVLRLRGDIGIFDRKHL